MDELLKLQQELAAIQKAPSVFKLSEPNIVVELCPPPASPPAPEPEPEPEPAPEEKLWVGQTLQGSLAPGEILYYPFAAQAGAAYTISTELSTLPDSVVLIYDQDRTTELAQCATVKTA